MCAYFLSGNLFLGRKPETQGLNLKNESFLKFFGKKDFILMKGIFCILDCVIVSKKESYGIFGDT